MQTQSTQLGLQRISLNGEWLIDGYQDRQLTGTVPGCIHTDLLAHELIPDLHFRDNESQMHWVYEQDWTYSRQIELSEEQVQAATLFLRCHGLDTLATISVNGAEVAKTNNMHRTYEFDLKPHARAGSNDISITFHNVLPFLAEHNKIHETPSWNLFKDEFKGKAWIRKMACSFGWDWGPIAPSMGIWRDIEIMCSDHAYITDIALTQDHSENQVDLGCTLQLDQAGENLSAELSLSLNGEAVGKTDFNVNGATGQAKISISGPALWWPLDLGEQTLYDLEITLRNQQGDCVDQQHKRIGLRTLDLIRENDDEGQSFTFQVNGQDFFAKGANWVPVHNYLPFITREHYDARLTDAVDAHMNMIRVWGGGIYEDDNFYDLCDEKGILLWQDFMFACSTYPTFDDEFNKNVSAEFSDNVKRLRHHPSIALWCGNNELEQGLVSDEWNNRSMSWTDYSRIFDDMLPKICADLDPQRSYWPGSPHTPIDDRNNSNDQRSGDCHLWSVWFGNKPFEAQRDWTCRFMSEFGFQSFPEPKTLNGFTDPKDRNLSSYVMDFHQRSGPGNKTIYKYIMDWFLLPKNLDETLWLSQVSQGLCVKYATEHLRRLQPHNMGVLYWQINDIWPCASWASVDYHGRWKALQYMAKQFFAPLLVSILEFEKDWTFGLNISNHHLSQQDVDLEWMITDTSGKILKQGEQRCQVESQANLEAFEINCSDLKDSHEHRDILCWASIKQNGEVISRNFGHICKPKYITLQEPSIEIDITELEDGRIALTLSSNVPALWTRIENDEQDIRWTDNFINLNGQESVRVESVHAVTGSVAELSKQIRVSSLYHSAWD